MQKIPTLFKRDRTGDRLVYNEVAPECEWVISGKGVATRKFDGTCCMIRDGRLYKRQEVKKDGKAPDGFEPVGPIDTETGKQQGWVPVGDGPADRYHREAFSAGCAAIITVHEDGSVVLDSQRTDGTYELVGPKVQGNPDMFGFHVLVKHGAQVIDDFPRDFNLLIGHLYEFPYEGVVWHSPDGRMAKIKRKDFYKS